MTLRQIAPGESFKFRYEYDFGDSWLHQIIVEKVLPPEAGQFYPVCIKGKRAYPPEVVGGIWGYYEFLEAIQNPEHSEQKVIWSGWVASSILRLSTWTKSTGLCVS